MVRGSKRPRIRIAEEVRVPDELPEQLTWNVGTHVPVPQQPNVQFEDLPEEVKGWFKPSLTTGVSGEEQGPLPQFSDDKSIICTHPEWRAYWKRQGVFDSVCQTSTKLADILRKLRTSLASSNAQLCHCKALKKRITELYDEKATMARAIREYQHEQVRLRERVRLLEKHLQDVVNEIQKSYPRDDSLNRGLSGDIPMEQVRLIYPHLFESVRKIVNELNKCNAQLNGINGSPGIDSEIETLKLKLDGVAAKVRVLTDDLEDANRKLAQANDIISRLVKLASSMGYSLNAIDESVQRDGDETSVREFLDGVKRYKFEAPLPPSKIEPVSFGALGARMDDIKKEMQVVKDKCKGTTVKGDFYPFKPTDAWYMP